MDNWEAMNGEHDPHCEGCRQLALVTQRDMAIGMSIWAVGEWLEAHYDGLPYEIFNGEHGYRFIVERIPQIDLT